MFVLQRIASSSSILHQNFGTFHQKIASVETVEVWVKAMAGTSNFHSENWGRIYSPVPVVSTVKPLTLGENLLAPSTLKRFFLRNPEIKMGSVLSK